MKFCIHPGPKAPATHWGADGGKYEAPQDIGGRPENFTRQTTS